MPFLTLLNSDFRIAELAEKGCFLRKSFFSCGSSEPDACERWRSQEPIVRVACCACFLFMLFVFFKICAILEGKKGGVSHEVYIFFLAIDGFPHGKL